MKLFSFDNSVPYNKLVNHVIQSWEWGLFRQKLGTKLIRFGLEDGKDKIAFQMTLHPIPFTNLNVGYLPKGPFLNKALADALIKIGKEHNCAFIKLEPNIRKDAINPKHIDKRFKHSPKPMFTRHNFVLDLTPSEDELLKNMHPKTRYNIRVAQKHEVAVEIRNDNQAFEDYLKLYFDTTRRQGYFGHDEHYHRLIWETLSNEGMAFLLIAYYTPEGTKKPLPLTAWMLLSFKDTLYYPYGGSSVEHRQVMSNNLVAWEAIKLGKKMGLKRFDMWGALGPDADPKHPHFGFHNFKKGYGGELVEYIGTYDLVLNYPVYYLVTFIDKFTKVKAFLLKLLGK
jgi:peptidoglycan pentaglycine glycine transferase (the first glycine)